MCLLNLIGKYSKAGFFYKNKYYKIPELSKTIYYSKQLPKGYGYGMCCTIDDPEILKVRDWALKTTKNFSERERAEFILCIAQQYCKYVKDIDNYNIGEYWQAPITTLINQTGDCEDSSLVGASLSHLCGIKTKFATGYTSTSGHAWYCVKVDTKIYDNTVDIDGEKYVVAESTGVILSLGLSRFSNKYSEIEYDDIIEPTEEFKSNLK
jgi:hypothetical protein